jgi:hypothetical protein
MTVPAWTYQVARRIAQWRSAPALHPQGLMCTGVLDVPGSAEARWGAAWLDRPGSYPVTVRWSRALGLPAALPDGLGLAVRVPDADGSGTALDLLLTSSGADRLGRHLPLPRHQALAGPYSTLLSYQAGDRERVLVALPVRGDRGRVRADLPAMRRALDQAPIRFELCAAGAGEPWHRFGTLTLLASRPAATHTTVSYDPYAHCLPELRPTARLRRLRSAAYRGSRRGRSATTQ